MITLTLRDGKQITSETSLSGIALATMISSSLAKEAGAIVIDSQICDLSTMITQDAKIEVIKRNSTDGLDILRHDAAHVLAQAIKELYPAAQITIGPVIENGFYYDISYKEPLSFEDLSKLEERMHAIVDRDIPITREVWQRDKAVAFFESIGEHFKAELIRDIDATQEISLYRQGDFIDLCRGPHFPSTRMLGHAFKLMKIAGAYWRGDSRNPMLQRIYGTAWLNDKDLQAYLTQLEEAEKRDHRKIGKAMELFHLQEEARGSIFWHPRGWSIYLTLESYIRRKIRKFGYQEVKTPILVDLELWKASGHWEKFRENMFTSEVEDQHFALKPMNCPCHVQIFNQGLKSYRDLPLRLSEFGACHRYEPSGALHGLMRVRGFVQDDGHIFCTPDQITSETKAFCALLHDVYRDFGFESVSIKFSDRPAVRAGSDAVWDQAEEALKCATEESGLEYTLNPGEGAFYGPKLEFVLKDAIGREWQCGTLQVDFVLPERLDANYIGEDGAKHRPVMLHRAILGSLERFIGVLIEHYSGKFPLWLAPIQVVIATITQDADAYGQELFEELQTLGIRVELDTRNEKINLKIREWSLQKVPQIWAVGRREVEEITVAIRTLGHEGQKTLSRSEAVATLQQMSATPD